MLNFIKDLINSYYHKKLPIVYGGNINITNIKDFTKLKNLDGFIIGNSSLNSANLAIIIENMT